MKVWAHVTLAELRDLDDGSVVQREWIGEMAVRWAARRAAASQTGSDGAAWLNGKPARAIACDATLIPVVTGGIDPAALDDLVTLCLQYGCHGCCCMPQPDLTPPGLTEDPSSRSGQPAKPAEQGLGSASGPSPADRAGLRPPTPEALEMLRHAIIGTAVNLVSGPGGVASFLRRNLLGKGLNGPSLPLDVGETDDIPVHLRRLVALRDQGCQYPGGYFPYTHINGVG